MTVSSIRTKLATALGTITGLRVYTDWPSSLAEYPAAVIRPMRSNWNIAVPRSQPHVSWQVTIYVPLSAGLEQAQGVLDDYIETTGAKSVKAAIEGYASYATDCSFARVTGWSEYGGYEFAGIKLLGVRFDVETY